VYRFFGGFTTVCATSVVTEANTIAMRAAVRFNGILVAMAVLRV
jgi:hypothetical protein